MIMNNFKTKNIAFDVDGTLIHHLDDSPRYNIIQLMMFFIDNEEKVYVWSGGGIDYAQRWVDKLGFTDLVDVVEKGSFIPDIAFDDEHVSLGIVNVLV